MSRMVLVNGKIYVDRGVFAEAVYAENDIIRAVGKNQEILETAGEAEIIDLQGKTVIPGLNDSHMHLLNVGMGFAQAKIIGVTSMTELIDRVRVFMKEHPEEAKNGILSKGWNQDLFTDEKRMPTRYDLDQITTEIPIVLKRVCGHVASVNSRVIELLGLDKTMVHVDGGTIETDESGRPNGIFTENAVALAEDLIPKYTLEDNKRLFLRAVDYALAHGVTSVQSNDVGNGQLPMEDVFRLLHEVYDAGLCKLRYRHQVCVHSVAEFKKYVENGEFKTGVYENPQMLALGPVKLFKDGSLGGRTAAMRKGYLDDPENYGVEARSNEEMEVICQMADKAGIQVVTHVIGDKAIEDVLGNYEHVLRDGKNPLRHALIHCQITDRPLLERIARNDVLVAYQPIFLDYDMHVVTSRCGEALSSTSYAFKTAKELGIHVSYGTDSPVEDLNPFPNLYSAITRKDKNGSPEKGFYPEECVDVSDAIDAYTAGSAYNEFSEDFKGRIKPGYLADMVVLDRDIFTCNPMEIRDILPEMTIVGGAIVFQKQK
ncbi:amidohydrolase [Lachnospiraceae bacterium 45-P1]